MPLEQPEFDVAISFLSQDEPTADALSQRLSEDLKVFFYPRNQEELAGTDGLETMSRPFLDNSHLVVVLYREPWGTTPWTRVEETAVKARCLKEGWQSLFFMTLDKTSVLPKWLPPTHVRFSYTDFGLEQAVGAIKMRVQECGGIISPPTALSRAALIRQEAVYLEDKKWLNSSEAVKSIGDQLQTIFLEIENKCKEIQDNTGLRIRVGRDASQCVMTDNRVSLAVGCYPQFSTTIEGRALRLTEFNAPIALPQEPHFDDEPPAIKEIQYLPELSRARELCWKNMKTPTQLFTPMALAEKCVMTFLDLVERTNQGKVTYPSITILAPRSLRRSTAVRDRYGV